MGDRRVRDLMTTDLLTLEQNEPLLLADEKMEARQVRHLIVVDEEGALAGVLSQRDIFLGGLLRGLGYGSRARDQALESLRLKDAMKASPVTTTPDTAVADAAETMITGRIGCLPVLEGERIVGILTEGDFVALAAGRKSTE